MKVLKDLYKDGFVSKDDLAAALRGHHATKIAMKSPQRDRALEMERLKIEHVVNTLMSYFWTGQAITAEHQSLFQH